MSNLLHTTEQIILGACLLEASAFGRVCNILHSGLFTEKLNHHIIWEVMQNLYETKKPIDIIMVYKEISKLGNFDFKNLSYYMATLTSRVFSTNNLEFHALVLIELWLKEKLKQLAFISKRGLLGVNVELAEAMGELYQALLPPDADPLNILYSTLAYLRINFPFDTEHYQGIIDLDNEFNATALRVRDTLGKHQIIAPPPSISPPNETIVENWPTVNTKDKQRAAELEQQMQQEAIILQLNF